jgi:hypothetical protein
MLVKKLLLIINISFIIILILSCENKTRMVEIKLLLLTSENYYDLPAILTGKIYEVGPGGLWFVLEDKTGFIQVTTENIPTDVPCIQLGNEVVISGKLLKNENHKYFSFSSLLRCNN